MQCYKVKMFHVNQAAILLTLKSTLNFLCMQSETNCKLKCFNNDLFHDSSDTGFPQKIHFTSWEKAFKLALLVLCLDWLENRQMLTKSQYVILLHQNLFVYLQITKRRKLGSISIPAVQTAAMGESKISIEQLSSFKDLLENIENIEVSISRR